MKKANINENEELREFCRNMRCMIEEQDYVKANEEIKRIMSSYPDSPVPHNLLGIILEKEHQHVLAMKHFRAAYALEPSYEPVKRNLNIFGEWQTKGIIYYYDYEDCIAG